MEEKRLNERLRELGQESARHLAAQLELIPQELQTILILTHVPPWPQAAWHHGRQSEADALARFCWAQGGEVIDATAASRPEATITVLCGHTHSGGCWGHENVICHTGGSEYRKLHHNASIEVIEDKITVSRLDGKLEANEALRFEPVFPSGRKLLRPIQD